MAEATVTERVARGAALLDEKQPGWDGRIDLAELDMRCNCIVQQLFAGDYSCIVMRELGLPESSDDIDHGFLWDSLPDLQNLDAEWRRVIDARRAAVVS